MTIASLQQSNPSARPRNAEPARLQPLATLPVFMNLKGRRAVVVGGTAAAAWKAELLAASGAHVEVYASQTCQEMTVLIARGASAGKLTLFREPFTQADLSEAAVLIADAEDEQHAIGLQSAARAAGVPINVIDRPDYCDFQFGSIVNRSPVVVGISTDGAAPVLSQAIRRRIETLLPSTLSAWADYARTLRTRIAEVLQPGEQRRALWERFCDQAFRNRSVSFDLDRELETASRAPAGRVTLVGAGPGDAEMLTVKAIRALQAADVILFDALVSDEVLELARREARRMLVGKRGGRQSCRQEDINQTMLHLAKAGRNVVRLKSGDPMLFGRGGEEIEILREAGIEVSIVPGVTSALAMAASLGVSLTHRDCSQSVRFVTGHSRTGELPSGLDWRDLASENATTIFYMGGRTSRAIAETLIAHGMTEATPVAIASAVTRPDEKRWVGSLAELREIDVRSISGDDPVLIGVGRVFGAAAVSTTTESDPQTHEPELNRKVG